MGNSVISSSKKEIIVVTVEFGDGGAERVLSELMAAWVAKGHKVTLIQTMPGIYGRSYNVVSEIESIDIHTNRKTKVGRYYFETISLLRYLKKRPNATVLAFANASIRIVGICSFFTSNRIVFSERCDPRYTPSTKMMRLLRDWLFGRADVCVFQTQEAKQLFPKNVQKKGIVIPNPINPDLPDVFHGQRRKVIITASRLAPQKNLSMLIRSFAKLVKEYPEYSLEIYGTGDEKKSLQEQINSLGLGKSIKLMGHSSNIHNIMRESAMYVCSSDYEGLSNSILEALGLGLPVVSTDHPIGGARTMITDGVDGFLTPVGDADAFYAAMKFIIDNPDIALKVGENASKIRERWPVQKIADLWLNIL